MAKSFIKLPKDITDWEWFTDGNVLKVWIYCLSNAKWKDEKYRGIDIPRGSFTTSIENIAKKTKLTNQNVRTSLKKLEKSENLTIKSTNKFTQIFVINYDNFQGQEVETNKQTNNQLTNNSQTTNKQTNNYIRNKEYKEIKKNLKEVDSREQKDRGVEEGSKLHGMPATPQTKTEPKKNYFVKPSIKELTDYARQIGYDGFDAEKFYDYYESIGWEIGTHKMRDWKSTVKGWMRRDADEGNGARKRRSNYKPNGAGLNGYRGTQGDLNEETTGNIFADMVARGDFKEQ